MIAGVPAAKTKGRMCTAVASPTMCKAIMTTSLFHYTFKHALDKEGLITHENKDCV